MVIASHVGWFLIAAVMLLNIVIWRPKLRRLVTLGSISDSDAKSFLAAAFFALVVPCALLGIINLWANYPIPACALMPFALDGVLSATTVVFVLCWWATLIAWVWLGNGAELVARVTPLLRAAAQSRARPWTARSVRIAGTCMVVGAGVSSFVGTFAFERARPEFAVCGHPIFGMAPAFGQQIR